MAKEMMVQVSIKMSKPKMILVATLIAAESITKSKLIRKIIDSVLKRSIKLTPVNHEQSTSKS
ncbi:hypothetical protein [Acinetobacter soli]|uniref:hypothetical protein n=1 Tax=Acinetobacter soli TaxID=487316 RepID=UPI00125033CC|nr:hypothetical protein [Acinetobacter soli]MCF3128465.1 hypothetical protein [Acinetobacter soli]